jgi:hypothetical protein
MLYTPELIAQHDQAFDAYSKAMDQIADFQKAAIAILEKKLNRKNDEVFTLDGIERTLRLRFMGYWTLQASTEFTDKEGKRQWEYFAPQHHDRITNVG